MKEGHGQQHAKDRIAGIAGTCSNRDELARHRRTVRTSRTPVPVLLVRLWFEVETHHQTGGESWGVRRGGRHGKGDCQIRRYHRNKRQLHQQFVFSDRSQIQLNFRELCRQGGGGRRAAEAARWLHLQGRRKTLLRHSSGARGAPGPFEHRWLRR